ncbi:MAG: IS110 family transposase [Bryobacteraceae bacterium]|nr:IS110 family transposase [Bryobacteraceae bacterium]
MIPAIVERGAGIDVGKTFVVVCIMIGPLDQEPRVEIRTFGTTNGALEHLRQWLVEEECTHVAMESTGSYWKPVFNVLEESLTVILANAEDVKGRKGHKTDPQDSRWLAHLLRHGLIRPSFIPPRTVRQLRDLTRLRRQLLNDSTSERNRIQKILEDANVKMASVLADPFGVSGQLMLEALLEGKASAEDIAELAKGRARSKIPELRAALEGHRLSDHHRRMIRYSLEHLAFLDRQLLQLDGDILRHIETAGFGPALELIKTVPGIQQDSAMTVLAEIGPNVSTFPSAAHLSSWAGLCPGNRRSAGKEKSVRTTRGNRWLRTTMTQCAWAASMKKDCYLKGKFWRLAAEGKKRAIVAVAHNLVVLVYHVLATGTPYQERGGPPEERHKQRRIRHHIRALGRLGVNVGCRPAT